MAASDAGAEAFLEQSHVGWAAFITGDPEPAERMFSRSDDVSLGNPFGPFVRGWSQSKAVMERSLRGLHRMVFAIMATPERFVKHAQSLWNMHHDSGRLELRMLSPVSLEASVLDSPVHHPFACMLNHYGCAVTLEAMGCKGLTDRRVCAFTERGVCSGLYYWRP